MNFTKLREWIPTLKGGYFAIAMCLGFGFGIAFTHLAQIVKSKVGHSEEECYYLPSGFKTRHDHGWALVNASDRYRIDKLSAAGVAEKELEGTALCYTYDTMGFQTNVTVNVRRFWWWRMVK